MKHSNYISLSIFVLALLLLTATLLVAGENVWTTEGPYGASVRAIAINPLDHNILFIGTIQSGIFRSVDAGENWTRLDSDITYNMRKIVLHPSAPDTMYAATVGGIFKSTDQGLSWLNISPAGREQAEYRALVLDPSNPNIILTGGIFDHWKSTNSGQTWTEVIVDPQGGRDKTVEALAIDPLNTNVVYLLTSSGEYGKGIYKSTDQAETWSNVHNNADSMLSIGTDIAIDPSNTQVIYWARYDATQSQDGRVLYKSTNGGGSWLNISPSTLVRWGIRAVRVSPVDPNIIFAASDEDGIFRSTDAGSNWQSANQGLTGRRCATIEIDSLGDVIYLGLYFDGIFKSSDGGTTWREISQNIKAVGCNDLDFVSALNDSAVVVAKNGCFIQQSEGSEWQRIETGIPPTNFAAAIAVNINIPSIVNVSTYSSVFPPANPNGLQISLDGGSTWQFRNNGLPINQAFEDIAVSYPANGEVRLFIAASFNLQSAGIYYSDNLGENWQVCQGGLPPQIYYLIRVAPGDNNVIAAVFPDRGIFISTDRGTNWSGIGELQGVGDEGIIDIEFHPNDSNHLFVSLFVSGLFESTDQGQNWTCINNDLPLYPGLAGIHGPAINLHNTQNMFVTCTQRGVFQSHDGGSHWEPFNMGFDTIGAYGEIYFVPGDTTRLFVASATRSVWSIHRTLTGVEDDTPPLPQAVSLSAYPNPFNSSTTINYSLPKAGHITITICNILGQSVATLYSGIQNAGPHSLAWDATPFSSGLYFARLNQDGNIKVAKLLLLK
jgi:photosystem II stability/assembly factor-like uncharacterized protein